MKEISPEDKKYRKIMKYVLITFSVMMLITLAVIRIEDVAAFCGKTWVFVAAVLKPIIFGVLFAVLLNPLTEKIEGLFCKVKFLKKRKALTRVLAVVLAILLVFLVLSVIIAVLMSVVTSSVQMISVDSAKNFVSYAGTSIQNFWGKAVIFLNSYGVSREDIDRVTAELGKMISEKMSDPFLQQSGTEGASNLGNTIAGVGSAVGNFLKDMGFMLVFGIYFLIDGKNLIAFWSKAAKDIFGKKIYPYLEEFVLIAQRSFSGYVRGQLVDAIIMSVLVSISLSIVGVDYSVAIGIGTGIGNLIPYVGPFVAYAMTIIVCLVEGEIDKLIIAAIVLLVIQVVDAQIINPRIVSSNVEVHPVLVVVALIAGGSIGGLAGMFLAVPCAAVIKIYFGKFIEWRKNGSRYNDSDKGRKKA